ncbi:MAG: peptide chain release factor 1 [Candidatus Omnitrophota bacterium]
MQKEFEVLEKRFNELEELLSDPVTLSDKVKYQNLAKEHSVLSAILKKYHQFNRIDSEIISLEKTLKEKHDVDFLALAEEELTSLVNKKNELLNELEIYLYGSNDDLDKDVIIEIRAGTGGNEASLFAADLYRMYTKYAALHNWKVEIMSSHPTELGGFKEIIFSISGHDAFRRLKFESGVHRVQRVPATEASGRIHTSTVTVAVLVEPKEIDFEINPKDLKIDVFRSSGPGGQGVNTTDSAVRITYLPIGMVVTCQDERSQLKNKAKAMRVLRAKLLDAKQSEETRKISEARKSQIGTGERSEKIRTYNFPDRRVTDHRIGLTIYQLDKVMEGEIDEFVDGLLKNELEEIKKHKRI